MRLETLNLTLTQNPTVNTQHYYENHYLSISKHDDCMSTLINYTAWFNLFALALNLLNDPLFQEELELKSRWGDISALNLVTSNNGMAMFIDVSSRENDQIILSYVLIVGAIGFISFLAGAEMIMVILAIEENTRTLTLKNAE